MSPISLTPASPQDAEAVARLQAQSWRIAYRGMLPDEYLEHHVVADRLAYWPARFAKFASDHTLVLKAVGDGTRVARHADASLVRRGRR